MTISNFVGIDVVRGHLNTLRSSGLSNRDIARISGYGDDFVSKLLCLPNQKTVTRAVAEVFLSIHPDRVTSQAVFIDAVGTRRRLQGLAALGWTLQYIADLYGCSMDRIWRIQRLPKVSRETAAKVTAIYDQLSTKPGPSHRTRKAATRHGWVPPAAWDDHEIDDPDATPATPPDEDVIDEIAIERVLRGDDETGKRLTELERAEVIRVGISRGMTSTTLGRLLHVNNAVINRVRDAEQAAA